MQFLCRINDFDITPFIKEDGVKLSYEDRVQRQITTADGVLHKKEIRKSIGTIDFRDMDDEYYSLIKSHVLVPNPATFFYTNFVDTPINNTYYVTDEGFSVKKVVAGVSVITGFSIELTQK